MVTESFIIDDGLRQHFHAFEQLLGICLSTADVDRVFKDADENQTSQKSYTFHQSACLSVIGFVEAYEPETICIRVEGTRPQERALTGYIEDARLLKPNGPL